MRCNPYTQFLPQFPLQCMIHRFARFELATRKFPQAALVRVRMPQAEQYLSAWIAYSCCSDVNGFHTGSVPGNNPSSQGVAN